MSEWGNPTEQTSVTLAHKWPRERTQGSETSQYLEEKRTIIFYALHKIVIPLVAASEKGEV